MKRRIKRVYTGKKKYGKVPTKYGYGENWLNKSQRIRQYEVGKGLV